MAKTITLRVEDKVYELIKKAAEGDRRNISNFIEYATLSYLTNEIQVTDNEMNEILSDNDFTCSLKKSLKEAKNGKFNIVG